MLSSPYLQIYYICLVEIYIYSFGCSPATADIEFMWTQNNENASRPTAESHLARHFIQSFDPGETTPEVAHEIGKRLAEEVFGKYEYVLATHTDRGHIHNHIIANDVSFVDYKRSHINEKWYYKTRKISDIELDFFEKQSDGYKRQTVDFCERVYEKAELETMLKKAGLKLIVVHCENGFSRPNKTSQRNIYVARKE